MTWLLYTMMGLAVLAWFAYELWTAPVIDDLEPNEVSLWKSLREDER